jgi:hypothetical protein
MYFSGKIACTFPDRTLDITTKTSLISCYIHNMDKILHFKFHYQYTDHFEIQENNNSALGKTETAT